MDELKIINQIALVYADYGQTKAAVSLYSQLLQYLDGHLQSLEPVSYTHLLLSVALQYILDKRIKRYGNRVSWVIVKLPHQTSPKGDHIPHE